MSRTIPTSSLLNWVGFSATGGQGFRVGTKLPSTIWPPGSSHSRPCIKRLTPRPAGTLIFTVRLRVIFWPLFTDSSLLLQSLTSFQYPLRSKYRFHGLAAESLAFGSAFLITICLNVTFSRVGAACGTFHFTK